MAGTRMSWREKLTKKQEPVIVDIPPKMQKRFGKGKMLIPKPLDVDALMRRIKVGKLATQSMIREKLSRDFGVTTTCPLTTGIFIRIAAEAAEEDLMDGREDITPYWRVVKDDGSLNEKFPGGAKAQAKRLEREGHTIIASRSGKRLMVKDYEKCLQKL